MPPPVPARQDTVRGHNLALVLGRIAGATGPISRADLAAATGLTRATVSTLVETLIADRLVTEAGLTPRPGAGRPATGLRLSTQGPAGLGLEVNVDYLAACVLDLAGGVRHHATLPGDQRGRTPDQALADTGRLAADAIAAAGAAGLTIVGATLALPGLVEAPTGPLRLAPNLGWRDVDALRLLRREPALRTLPLTVDNEANLAALAELSIGTAGDTFLYVSGEVGIGAGIVLDGRIFRGRHGWAGELGHIAIHPDGPPCRCGARGCLEQYAGKEALLAAAAPIPGGAQRGAQARDTEAPLAAAAAPSLEQVAWRADAADATVLGALDAAGTALGVAIAGALNLLDVASVVLGGDYRPLTPWLAPAVEREIAARVPAAPWSTPRVYAASVGTDAATIGAAQAVIHAVLRDPTRAQRLLWRPAPGVRQEADPAGTR